MSQESMAACGFTLWLEIINNSMKNQFFGELFYFHL